MVSAVHAAFNRDTAAAIITATIMSTKNDYVADDDLVGIRPSFTVLR
jgi:hypothetical protein